MTRGMIGGLALLAAVAGGQTVAAQDRPTILPTRDVAITYRATGPVQGQQQQQDLKVAFTSAGRLMRVEGVGGQMSGAYVIVDHTTQRMTMVMSGDRRFIEMPVNNAFSRGFLLSESMKFVRRGGDSVAGVKCTVWDITSPEAVGTACLTEDGVMLRGSGLDGKGALVATSVTYGAQSAALFKPPADFSKIEMPAGMPPAGMAPGSRPPGR